MPRVQTLGDYSSGPRTTRPAASPNHHRGFAVIRSTRGYSGAEWLMGSTALGATGLLLPIDSGPFGPGPSPQPVFELCLGGVAGISISHYRLPSLIQRRPTHIVPPQGGHPVWCGITKRSPRRDTRAKSRSLIRHGGSSAPSDGTMTREKYTIVKGNHLMNTPGARRVAFVQAAGTRRSWMRVETRS